MLGAPEALLAVDGDDPLRGRATEEAATGRRVLALAAAGAPLPPAAPDAPLPQPLRPLGVVVLAERLRANAGETVAFFAAEEVGLKVVSGDSPATVGAIARDAGIPAESAALDGGALPEGDEALLDAVRAAPAIGRISPEDKARVVRVLAESGDYVGMLGDGVNDVPALKQARLAIAQGSGTQMARAVADLVLVSGEFGEVPRMVHEGRQILRNIQRVARLFVTKALFTAFLLVTIALPSGVFPLLPRQFTLDVVAHDRRPRVLPRARAVHRALATGGLPQGDRPLLDPGGSRDRHRDPHRVPRRPPRVRHLAHRGADGDRGDGRHRGPRGRHGARGRAGPPAPARRRALRAHGARLRDRLGPADRGASSSTSRRRRARWSPSWAIGAAVTIVLLVVALRAVRVLDARAEQPSLEPLHHLGHVAVPEDLVADDRHRGRQREHDEAHRHAHPGRREHDGQDQQARRRRDEGEVERVVRPHEDRVQDVEGVTKTANGIATLSTTATGPISASPSRA